MEIFWFGQSCFLFRGKTTRVVTDPYETKVVGLKLPKVEADIVTVSHTHPDHNATTVVSGVEGSEPFVVRGPGEYEIKGVSIFGVSTFHDEVGGTERGKNTVYVIEVDGIKICHLGDLGHKLTEEQLKEIGDIDILLVPIGGFFTIDAKVGYEVVRQLEPKVVIPMHYKIADLNESIAGKMSGVEIFVKETGVEPPVSQPKLVLTQDKLPEQMQVVLLERKSS